MILCMCVWAQKEEGTVVWGWFRTKLLLGFVLMFRCCMRRSRTEDLAKQGKLWPESRTAVHAAVATTDGRFCEKACFVRSAIRREGELDAARRSWSFGRHSRRSRNEVVSLHLGDLRSLRSLCAIAAGE